MHMSGWLLQVFLLLQSDEKVFISILISFILSILLPYAGHTGYLTHLRWLPVRMQTKFMELKEIQKNIIFRKTLS